MDNINLVRFLFFSFALCKNINLWTADDKVEDQ